MTRSPRGSGRGRADSECPPSAFPAPATTDDPQQFNDLHLQWQRTKDPSLRSALIEQHVSLVHFLARKFRDRGESIEDLAQQGFVGLVDAFDRFDPKRHVKFTTYATPMIVGEIKRYFRDKGRRASVPRRLQELSYQLGNVVEELTQALQRSPTVPEIARALGVSEESVVEIMETGRACDVVFLDAGFGPDDEHVGTHSFLDYIGLLDEGIEAIDARSHLDEAFRVLDRRERTVVTLLFFEDMSQSEIAQKLGVSQMQVSRIKRAAMLRLREFIQEVRH